MDKTRITELHEKVLYPMVMVRTNKASGSGTVIRCLPRADGTYKSYILTNHHVIADCISVKDVYEPGLGKEIKKEFRDTVTVEFYDYTRLSDLEGRKAVDADILAYHTGRDIALLRLRASKKTEYVAAMLPPERLKDIYIFSPVYAVGCALGHKSVVTSGHIASMGDADDEIDHHSYWLSTAATVFGNSGGAVFLQDALEFIGIPSRIAVSIIGFGVSVTNHMGWFIPLPEIYRWLDDECYQFLYDANYTEEQCDEMRKKKFDAMKRLHARTDNEVVLPDDRPVVEKYY